MFEVLILTILSILGYSIIAGITAGILIAMGSNTTDDVEEAIERGMLWPFTIPMLIVFGITALINKLI